MQFLKLDSGQRQSLWDGLAGMPDYIGGFLGTLTREQIRTRGPDGGFAPVEQIWHLADLEREGFGVRIRKLLTEPRPSLPDFDGTRVARDRCYLELSPEKGLQAFIDARRNNLRTLQTLTAWAWSRTGIQDGIGEISLCDIPGFMAQHDAAHKAEIMTWQRSMTGT